MQIQKIGFFHSVTNKSNQTKVTVPSFGNGLSADSFESTRSTKIDFKNYKSVENFLYNISGNYDDPDYITTTHNKLSSSEIDVLCKYILNKVNFSSTNELSKKNKLTERAYLFRALGKDEINNSSINSSNECPKVLDIKKLTKGSNFEFKRPSATTPNIIGTSCFIKENQILLRIKAKQNMPCLKISDYEDEILQYADKNCPNSYSDLMDYIAEEKEIIMPPNMPMRITDIKKVPIINVENGQNSDFYLVDAETI